MVDGCQAIAKDTTYASVPLPPPAAVNAPSISSKRGRSPDSDHRSAELPADSVPRKKAKQPRQTGLDTEAGMPEYEMTFDWVSDIGEGLEWDENEKDWDVEVAGYDTSPE